MQTELDKTKKKLVCQFLNIMKIMMNFFKLLKFQKNIETLISFAEKKGKKKIKAELIRECLLSANPEIMKKLNELLNEKGD